MACFINPYWWAQGQDKTNFRSGAIYEIEKKTPLFNVCFKKESDIKAIALLIGGAR